MSAAATCDQCRTPGACCKGFVLNFRVSADNWRSEATEILARNNLDFIRPVRPHITSRDTPERVSVMFDCTRVGEDGRCTQYEDRPELCKLYEAGSDSLCAMHVQKLKGIPINVVHV